MSETDPNSFQSVPWDRRDTAAVVTLTASAFLIRLMLALLTRVIGADSAHYLLFAQEMQKGEWTSALGYGLHPAFSSMICFFGFFFGDLEAAGTAVTLVFSSLAVAAFYVLVRDTAGRRAAIVACLFFACLPRFVRVHADIMTEGLFHFLFVASVTYTWFGITRKRCTYYALAGVLGGFAYLARPEGVYTPIATLGMTLLTILASKIKKRDPAWRRLGFAALSAVIFLMIAFPLLLWIRQHVGFWTISNRGSVHLAIESVGVPTKWDIPYDGMGREDDDAPPPKPKPKPAPPKTEAPPPKDDDAAKPEPAGQKVWNPESPNFFTAVATFVSKTFRIGFVAGVLLTIAGLACLKGRMRPLAALYLCCLSAGYALPPVAVATYGYNLSYRYILVSTLFLLPFAAVGFLALVELASRRWDAAKVPRISAAALAVLLTAMVVHTVRPRREDKVPMRDAAVWLSERLKDDSIVYCNNGRIKPYIRRSPHRLPDEIAEYGNLQLRESDFVMVITEHITDKYPGGLEILREKLRVLKKFPDPEPEDPDIYRVIIFVRKD